MCLSPGDVIAQGCPERDNGHADGHRWRHQRVVTLPVIGWDKESVDPRGQEHHPFGTEKPEMIGAKTCQRSQTKRELFPRVCTWWGRGCTGGQWWEWHWCPSASSGRCPPGRGYCTSLLCRSCHSGGWAASAAGLQHTPPGGVKESDWHQTSHTIWYKEIIFWNWLKLQSF